MSGGARSYVDPVASRRADWRREGLPRPGGWWALRPDGLGHRRCGRCEPPARSVLAGLLDPGEILANGVVLLPRGSARSLGPSGVSAYRLSAEPVSRSLRRISTNIGVIASCGLSSPASCRRAPAVSWVRR